MVMQIILVIYVHILVDMVKFVSSYYPKYKNSMDKM
jgi:hypothetical protein